MADDAELLAAWGTHIGDNASALGVFDDVIGRHRQPWRHYHGVHHVTWVIRHVHDLVGTVTVADVSAVFAAGFFHDAVYDPRAGDNEARSAELAERSLDGLGWTPARRRAVAAMVEATAAHSGTDDPDTAVLLDADLAVLGADPAAYQAYVTGVRAEYTHLDDESWRAGRRAVLESLLAAEPLYSTPPGRRRWGPQARANLAAELVTLA